MPLDINDRPELRFRDMMTDYVLGPCRATTMLGLSPGAHALLLWIGDHALGKHAYDHHGQSDDGKWRKHQLYDMHGNASQWCADWHDTEYYYHGAYPLDDPTGPESGSFRVLRGSSWNVGPIYARCANSGWSYSDYHGDTVGFRVSRTK